MRSGLVTYVHNFVDDIGTANHYLPWSDEIESGTGGGRYYLAMPFNSMLLRRFVIRFRTLSASSSITVNLGTIANGDAVSNTSFTSVAVNTISQVGTSDQSYVLNHNIGWSATPEITQTFSNSNCKLVAIRIQSDIDPQSASNEIYVTSLGS